MPILYNIEVSYTIGKLLISTFQQNYVNLRTPKVLSPGVLVGLGHLKYKNVFVIAQFLMAMQKQVYYITVLIQGS